MSFYRRSRLLMMVALVMVVVVVAVPTNVGAYSTVISSSRLNSTVNGHFKGPFQYNSGTGTYTLHDHTASLLGVNSYYETAFISNSARSIWMRQEFNYGFDITSAVVVNSSGTVIARPIVNFPLSNGVEWYGVIGANSTLFLRAYGTFDSVPFYSHTYVDDTNTNQQLLQWTIQTS